MIELTKGSYDATSIASLFDAIAKAMGYENTDKLHYNCCKINVSKQVYEEYLAANQERGLDITSIVANWAICGPKANIEAEGLLCDPQDGFICT